MKTKLFQLIFLLYLHVQSIAVSIYLLFTCKHIHLKTLQQQTYWFLSKETTIFVFNLIICCKSSEEIGLICLNVRLYLMFCMTLWPNTDFGVLRKNPDNYGNPQCHKQELTLVSKFFFTINKKNHKMLNNW